ncbi:metal ABC transporter permease [Saccharothrix longispora]|uniref:ABC-type Mn2+/Zn2+ transport system permease subunit n=1 Tax=Saccharothrix longispora TaxID=33920 RepID=A0ABU1PUQ1_9PSEU|nr:metal ABC transporter permease [Saccharothrix longispora]MDR6594380.1 ABC-type Mn2+/Zn2+ transport system permease subunit [Saccharothrix longispora]
MTAFPDFPTAPWQYDFWRRALLVALMSGLVCGVIGSHVVLRGTAFIGDAVSHAVLPGIAASFGLGIVILSTAPGYGGSLESFLFGSILGISDSDVVPVALIGAAVLLCRLFAPRHGLLARTRRTAARTALPASGQPLPTASGWMMCTRPSPMPVTFGLRPS